MGSPLAKRKKLAAERTGYSKLKEAINADDLRSEDSASAVVGGKQRSLDGGGTGETQAQVGSPASDGGMQEGEDDEEEEEDGAEDDDDFLARELEEEWG